MAGIGFYDYHYNYQPRMIVVTTTLTDVELSKPKETMLTGLKKKILDKDIRTLIKAGFMDSNLDLTTEGKQEVWAVLYDKFKKDLVEAAEEKLEEKE